MAKTLYTLKIHNRTQEMHLFSGKFTPEDLLHDCSIGSESVCGEVYKKDSSKSEFTCKDEQKARELCAKIGRKVCANCIQELYKTL